jgi:hypothetical protein
MKNKLFLMGLVAMITFVPEINTTFDAFESEEDLACFAKIDLEKYHPAFEYLVKRVKQDFGIEKDITIWMLLGRADFSARYHFNNDFITVSDVWENHQLFTTCFAYRAFALAHEFEHHRQFKRYSGSYKNFERDRDKKAFWLALEQGADAAAAGYIECETCLKEIAMITKTKRHITQTDCGDFTSEKGYFTEEDFEPYIQRARDEKCICRAHWKMANCNGAGRISKQDFFELVKPDATAQERFEFCNNYGDL